ncbi:DNA damage-regulated autophagy modulator protein 1-like [Varroa destructor]|uniref:CWH43-like N-terminal domain-containing protein n=1 Tax=Varroa destructor TaxID=109461 RepID=A0A7M7KL96_VARDE|nr:DNA damage-regulated autophagy modulator protein 1-like [Varroa destructor]
MCLITSSMAVARGHVSGFVHISDTGTVPPESCVFGIMLTFFAVMVFFSVWNVYTTTLQPSALHGWVSIIGSLSAVGVIIVVNFQKITVFEVHIVGALTAFGPATVYIWLMLVLSPYMRIFRKFCAALVTFSLIATCMTDLVSILKFKGKDRLHWKPDDGGYELHVASVISEWFMVLGINLYIATLSTDIKRGKQRLEKRRGKKNMTQNEAAKKARLDVVQTQVVRANEMIVDYRHADSKTNEWCLQQREATMSQSVGRA